MTEDKLKGLFGGGEADDAQGGECNGVACHPARALICDPLAIRLSAPPRVGCSGSRGRDFLDRTLP